MILHFQKIQFYSVLKKPIFQEEIDYVVFYDKPFLKFERLLETYFAFALKVLEVLFHLCQYG